MRQFNEDTLTDAVIARLKDASNPRFRQLITSLVKHVHAFARDLLISRDLNPGLRPLRRTSP